MACHRRAPPAGDDGETSSPSSVIESLTAAQGIDLRAPLATSPELRKAMDANSRGWCRTWSRSRYMAGDLAAARDLVAAAR